MSSNLLPELLKQSVNEVSKALPSHLSADRMVRIALTEYRRNQKLANCDPRSVLGAIFTAAQLGLEPGVLGQCYFIPYKTECQFIPGYQGLIELVRRTGLVKRIEAHVVHKNDVFEYSTGLETKLVHTPCLDDEPGDLRLAYAVAEFTTGGYHVEVMTRRQIEKIRDGSQGYQNAMKWKNQTPWEDNTDEMWRKTVLRRVCKQLPKSPELAKAIAMDDAATRGSQGLDLKALVSRDWEPPIDDVIDVPVEDVAEKLNVAAKTASEKKEAKDTLV